MLQKRKKGVTGRAWEVEPGGEVHQEVFEQLVDADADQLADTLRETLLAWIVEYNLPGAAAPSVWRLRARNEKAAAETRQVKAMAAEATDKAIRAIVEAAASFDHDQVAREYIVSVELTDGLIQAGRHAVQIDTPSPLADLLASARPFKAKPMKPDLPVEEYVSAFLTPFGAEIGKAVLWQDVSGAFVPISDQFFRDPAGNWKITKRDRAQFAKMMAETLLDPDEIWLGLTFKPGLVVREERRLLVERRYIRVSPDLGLIAIMEIGRKWWQPVTIYPTQDRDGNPDVAPMQQRRGRKLLWKRK